MRQTSSITYTRSIPKPVTSIIVDGDEETLHSSLLLLLLVVNAVLTPIMTSPTSNPACWANPFAVTDVMKTIFPNDTVVVVTGGDTKLSSMTHPSGRCWENVISTTTPVKDVSAMVVTTVLVFDEDDDDDEAVDVVVSSIF